ncbi:hypothetical protein C8D81_0314 [Enemella evansiae]|nr:hypothetical protein C8D81_0314 [Enemella evansiae]
MTQEHREERPLRGYAGAMTAEQSIPLSPAQESLLAAIVALETERTFDGNEPSATIGLNSQLMGIRRLPSDDEWLVPLVVHDAPPVALSDGPLIGRYWVGSDRRGEVVVKVIDGLLSSMQVEWTPGADRQWPTPADITTD